MEGLSNDNVSLVFTNDKCIGCTKCARACPMSCINGKIKEKHEIDKSKCIKCGACFSVCPMKAVVVK